MTTGYVDPGDGKLYYEIEGKGEVLVLIHAGFVDSRMWDGQWDAFIQHYRVLRFDMRGFGKSDPATGPVSRRQDLYRLLQELGIERAHVLGCSMGGEIAIDFTLEHPDMVLSLIVVSGTPGGFEMRGAPPSQLLEMLQALEQGDLNRVSDLQIRLWVDGSFRQPEQVDSRVRQRATEMNRIPVKNGTWAIADANPLNPLNPPATGRLGDLAVPALFMAGSLDNPEILRAADLLANEIKGAKKVLMSDTAHVPNMEKPAEFNWIVLDFLSLL
ncbi:hydrolase [Methanosarcina sp. 2.H.T.1A.6]|uniref:alpha/beta fold hydrolase n=1 Tax=unclassified Methanosarcina TaxID=2644672 RepID=UPI000620F73C|nr:MULTISPECIES: alpha/beta hydrolase [unclassified Methanosarcina]KKG13772.1 hydrolase [Methanosarcina sp. 2.H.T.1A.3]KKG21464.1 hydrolase [Methanosarcina sp. 2.H.T.1A.8]KKG21956.1 hydrolase [Methanosarcina sp. 2.H.T.1A.6]KKG26967.1 hydrolase [Methanosarcina sp. 2.H.T.1A.15]